MHTDWCMIQVFFAWNFDDYGLRLKNRNWRKPKKIKNRIITPLQRMKSCSSRCLVGVPFAWLAAVMQLCRKVVSLWLCWGVLQELHSSLELLRLAPLIFCFTMVHVSSLGFRDTSRSLNLGLLADETEKLGYLKQFKSCSGWRALKALVNSSFTVFMMWFQQLDLLGPLPWGPLWLKHQWMVCNMCNYSHKSCQVVWKCSCNLYLYHACLK